MKRRRIIFFALLAAGVATMAQAGDTATVRETLSGDRFAIEDGRIVQAAGLVVPQAGEPLAEEARRHAEGLVREGVLFRDARPARGVLLAGIVLPGGFTLQEEMLRDGLAAAAPWPGTDSRMPAWLALEQEARTARRGIWAHPYWQVADANAAGLSLPRIRYWLAEGVVLRISDSRDGDRYLHFGPDWSTDVTAKIRAEDYKKYFKRMDMEALEGKTLRLRGYAYMDDGPMIEIRLPQAIDVVDR